MLETPPTERVINVADIDPNLTRLERSRAALTGDCQQIPSTKARRIGAVRR